MGKEQKKYRKAFKGKNQRLFSQVVSRNDTRTSQVEDSYLMKTGTALEFATNKFRIIAAFESVQAYEFIEGNPGTDETIVPDEYIFNKMEPNYQEMVEIPDENYIQIENDRHHERMTELFENQELAAAQRNRFVSDEEIKHITNIENRANNRRKLEKIFDDKWKMYHELRKEYENKRAACIKKFYELFAPSILNHVKVQLENRQYKWAWYRICIHFGKMSGGTSAAVNIRSILSHLTFKPESRTFSEHRHILESYFTQLMAIGEVLSESYKYEILRNSVQRGSKLFDDIFISLTSHANPTYDLLLRLITEKSNELNVKKVVSLTMEEDDYHDGSNEKVNFSRNQRGKFSKTRLNKIGKQTRNWKCETCGKQGHSTENCFQNKFYCKICNKKGHTAGMHREIEASTTGGNPISNQAIANQKPNQVGEVNRNRLASSFSENNPR
jgi:hypothetical protein